MTQPTPPQSPPKPPRRPPAAPDRFHLLVDCRTEQAQRRLYDHLKSQGFSCRVLVL